MQIFPCASKLRLLLIRGRAVTHLVPGHLVPHNWSPRTNSPGSFGPRDNWSPRTIGPQTFGPQDKWTPGQLVPLDKWSPNIWSPWTIGPQNLLVVFKSSLKHFLQFFDIWRSTFDITDDFKNLFFPVLVI